MVKQYETWMANFNPRVGTEASKIRPVVIVQSDMLNSNHQSTMICPITSMLQPASHILRVHLWPDSGNGLDRKSDIMVDQIRTVDNNRLIRKISVLNQTAADTLRENLKIVLDF